MTAKEQLEDELKSLKERLKEITDNLQNENLDTTSKNALVENQRNTLIEISEIKNKLKILE